MRSARLMLLLGSTLTLACSEHASPDDGGGVGDDPPAATAAVNVQDNQFVSAGVRVLAGGTVRWTWQGNNPHNVTFAGGPASITQTEGAFERAFAAAGTFPYLCTVHGQAMSGTVTVVAPDEPAE